MKVVSLDTDHTLPISVEELLKFEKQEFLGEM